MIQKHGGNITEFENVLDFSANINPFGMPERVKQFIRESISDIEKYPDPDCNELRKKIAEHEIINMENIVCGNGADDLIFRIIHALRPKKALICAPAFSEYKRALAEVGCDTIEYKLTENNSFDVGMDILDKLDYGIDICFICNPNNPTGRLVPISVMKEISRRSIQNDFIFVSDECFLEFVKNGRIYSLRKYLNKNSVILKAFTKIYAIPGIRLGYAVCGSSDIAEKIHNSGQFWSVSSIAQKAGIAALEETEFVLRTVQYIENERNFLTKGLSDLNITVYDSSSNFILFKAIESLYEKMLAENILIRKCSNFSGLTEKYYRIAVRKHAENIALLAALGRCMNG